MTKQLSTKGDYWQMRMLVNKEKKYARFRLKTRNSDTAIDKAKKQYHNLISHNWLDFIGRDTKLY